MCSEEKEYTKETNKLLKQLENRGYDKTSTKMEIEKAHNIPHKILLTNNNIVKERKHTI